MIPFEAPVEDILFSLQHVARAGRIPGWDDDLVQEVIRQFARLAEGVVAPADDAADREGCRLEDGRVHMPAGLVAAYASFAEQGWPGLSIPEEAGGQGMPAPVLGAVTEIFAGASHALQMIAGLVPGASRTLVDYGTPDQQERWLPRLASGDWLATMALTEPGAGSDLSGIRTRGEQRPEGWRVSGEKIFISGGDQDLTPRILHLVLARTQGAVGSTRGLSLFLVPSHDDAGTKLPVTVTRIEEKMGLHGSPTCQMLFDGAPAELLGNEGEGLKAMFTMMNHARLDVALQGVAHAARATRIATEYARGRRQGKIAGETGPALLASHPDVQRMLDEAEAIAIAGRALCHVALVELELQEAPELVDFLTPVCKFACTEGGVVAANLAIQVLGGYGYLREYRVEQILRDARITAIYEGANGIHALTLATRLLRHDGGSAANAFAQFVRSSGADFELSIWQKAREHMLAATDPTPADDAFMRLTVETAYAAIWRRLSAVADHAPVPARLRALAARQAIFGPSSLRHKAEIVSIALRMDEPSPGAAHLQEEAWT
ncbi:acyl-CoA dehydrogenase family protein [Rhizobium sp. S95]|uniref:Acyl-CoA dehydrogenase family protein n=1 Tax=Ciceribacter sichuanensis TaxID=2949647 RepID=A0AAJ1C175_9HYPH|nr:MULTISPECIES: acyl-CoA dehydrogenase family protein [unclassified Ciceribacter]MCM2396640.1 acyl-CoA dehydrogenase family protein [Ciceribacter sp. S95]MCO5959867.1 acyl-CoA dehydrogenase family protein [Ciceribacter sp. S101]